MVGEDRTKLANLLLLIILTARGGANVLGHACMYIAIVRRQWDLMRLNDNYLEQTLC